MVNFFVTDKTADNSLFSKPIKLDYTPQEIQQTINKCHYKLTEEDIKEINQQKYGDPLIFLYQNLINRKTLADNYFAGDPTVEKVF